MIYKEYSQNKIKGIYTCVETSSDGSKSYGGYHVRVHYNTKPRITAPLRIFEGETYTLRCHSEGYQTPVYKWFFNGKAIDYLMENELSGSDITWSRQTGELTIGKFAKENVGNYSCSSYNFHSNPMSDKMHLDFTKFTDAVISAIVVISAVSALVSVFLIWGILKKVRKTKSSADDDVEANYVTSFATRGQVSSSQVRGYEPWNYHDDDASTAPNSDSYSNEALYNHPRQEEEAQINFGGKQAATTKNFVYV